MCAGVPILANNKKAIFGKKTNSHSTTCENLKIDGDKYRKFEYWWWEKKLVQVHYDRVAEEILNKIDVNISTKLAEKVVKDNFRTQDQLATWLKDVSDEWDKLLDPKFKRLAKKVNPLLLTFQDKIEKFKKDDIEKYNPYQAEKMPSLTEIKKFPQLAQVGDQVGDQVRDQVWATSYWGIKITLGLPIHHWFFDFLKLGVMIVFVKGKVKVFGKGGKYLGEYDESELK